MFVLKAKIEIGSYVFNSVNEIEITKSVENISDTAIIKMPRKFKVKNGNEYIYFEKAIKVTDEVRITLGYEGKYEGLEFQGYVTKIKPTIPLEIHCEDFVFLLRRKTISHNFGKTTLKKVLEEVIKDIKPPILLSDRIPDVPLNTYLVKDKNGAQVLQQLKEELMLTSFVDDENKLYCGLIEATNVGETSVYDLNYNIVENNLEIADEESKKYLVKYSFIEKKDNSKIFVEIGDKDGEKREYKTSIVSDKKILKEMAEEALKKLKIVGFTGSITSFLIPFATRGMVAKIIDNEHPNQAGNYFIKSVVTTYGISGARRKVEIGNRL